MGLQGVFLTQFKTLGLSETLLRATTAAGFETATPIQAKVIPELLNGRDVVGIAQTGTGKTASFTLPLLERLVSEGPMRVAKTCRALILVPTRELAAQINETIETLGQFVKPRTAVVVGGAKPGPQIRALAPGVDILVATPGRLLDHLAAGVLSLKETHTVVLDEADQMLDLGFFPAIRKIMGALPKQRQTVLLSATMPKQIRSLASDFLHKPVEVSVAPAAKPIDRIDQMVMHLDRSQKMGMLTNILSEKPIERAIVFTRTKRGADRVSRNLEKSGLNAGAIHGNKSQNQRTRVLDAFRSGELRILVATDIAARGIDVDDVSHVFNFELPNVPEAYVHRIGRTARAGKSGEAVSLCDPEEKPLLRDIERLIGASLKAQSVSGEDVPAAPMPEPAERKPQGQGRGHQARGRPSGKSGHGGGQRSAGPARGKARPARTETAGPGTVSPGTAGSGTPGAGTARGADRRQAAPADAPQRNSAKTDHRASKPWRSDDGPRGSGARRSKGRTDRSPARSMPGKGRGGRSEDGPSALESPDTGLNRMLSNIGRVG